MADDPTFGERYKAHAKAAEAKRRMDDALAALDKAEDEWRAACLECDRLDGVKIPTAAEVRGILKGA